jgi:hypothetical protein
VEGASPTRDLGQAGRVRAQHGIAAPIDRGTHLALRAAVLDVVGGRGPRRFPTTVHAGRPGLAASVVDGPALDDAGLRADVVLALLDRALRRAPGVHLWLTRPGALSPHDDDLRWLGPATWACQALGVPTGLVVVTRHGWYDPLTGASREWRRLRRPPRTARPLAGS